MGAPTMGNAQQGQPKIEGFYSSSAYPDNRVDMMVRFHKKDCTVTSTEFVQGAAGGESWQKAGETLERHGTWGWEKGTLILQLQEGSNPHCPVEIKSPSPEGDSNTEPTGLEAPTEWAVAVPYLELACELTSTPPETDSGIGGHIGMGASRGKASGFKQYLVATATQGYMRDKESGAEVDKVVLPWNKATVDKLCALM